MALTKETEYRCHINSVGEIRCITEEVIYDDGVRANAKIVHSQPYHAGDDVSDAPDVVRRLAVAEHTPERIAARQAVLAANEALLR